MGTAALEVNRGGRPIIPDHLELYLYVTVGARRQGVSVREFLNRRDTWFEGTIRLGNAPSTRKRIKREALRRRYNKSRVALGMVQYREGVIEEESPNDAVRLINKTINKMVEDLSS